MGSGARSRPRAQTAHGDWLGGAIPRCVSESTAATTGQGLRPRGLQRLQRLQAASAVAEASGKGRRSTPWPLQFVSLFLVATAAAKRERHDMLVTPPGRPISATSSAHCTSPCLSETAESACGVPIGQLTCARRRHNPDSRRRLQCEEEAMVNRASTMRRTRHCHRLDG
ncbi:hypothetical protein LX36DRAFT_441332 [Colletotrichum falcatum]|nr:hypothetical protein LX36DRAFT_441332 [Colletotrichum falcatum]